MLRTVAEFDRVGDAGRACRSTLRSLDDAVVFAHPIGKTRTAAEGHGVWRRGAPVDGCVP